MYIRKLLYKAIHTPVTWLVLGALYTWNESLRNKFSFGVKYVLVYKWTHPLWSDEPGAVGLFTTAMVQ